MCCELLTLFLASADKKGHIMAKTSFTYHGLLTRWTTRNRLGNESCDTFVVIINDIRRVLF